MENVECDLASQDWDHEIIECLDNGGVILFTVGKYNQLRIWSTKVYSFDYYIKNKIIEPMNKTVTIENINTKYWEQNHWHVE